VSIRLTGSGDGQKIATTARSGSQSRDLKKVFARLSGGISSGALLFKVLVPVVLILAVVVGNLRPTFAQWFGGVSNLVALFAALFTYTYVVLTAEMVRRITQAQREERRPYVLAIIEFEKHMAWFSVQNIGKTAALNVDITITPDLPAMRKENDLVKNILSKPISFLPPNGFIRTVVNGSGALFKEGAPREYVIRLSYHDASEDKPFVQEYCINLDSYEHAIQIGSLDIASVARHLETIERHLEAVSILATREYHSKFSSAIPPKRPPSRHRRVVNRILERRFGQR